jgi:hypothetical protein
MPADRDALRDWSARALAICREAAAAGHYETAYHALMAALHAAEENGDAPLLDTIAQVAGEQQHAIDALDQVHLLSSKSAADRGHLPVFQLAQRQAAMRATMARHKQASRE